MVQLYEIRELMTGLYKKYDRFINPVAKFLLALMVVIRLNRFFAYSPLLGKVSVSLAAAVLATFLPGSWFLLLLAVMIVFQLFNASVWVAAIVFVVIVVTYLLFVALFPDYSWIVLLTALLYSFKLVYLVPLVIGLFVGPMAIIPMIVGVGVYRFSKFIPALLEQKGGELSAGAPDMVLTLYNRLTGMMLNDKTFFLMAVIFSLTVLVVYFVSRMSIDYGHYVAIGGGAIFMLIGLLVGNTLLKGDVHILAMILGVVIASGLTAVAQFFRFSLDYQRAERLQFEDDHYYYHVKAIPKVKVSKSIKEIKKIK